MENNTTRIDQLYENLQLKIAKELEHMEKQATFVADRWKSGLGRGITMVLQQGDILEKAAVNFSVVSGPVTKSMRSALEIEDGESFFASGISSIIHPVNPHVPITHMNVRYFQLSSGRAWFGGGIDLTPHYVVPSEAAWFHRELKTICDRFDASYYNRFKQWADDYFYLDHRKETRGIGGIFFDHQLAGETVAFEKLLAFTLDLAGAYPRIYRELVAKNKDCPYSDRETRWQQLRRGRYVEFNLLCDRGTRFGVESGGRTESIFLSMPPLAGWEYDYQPTEDSPEFKTQTWLKKGINWIEYNALG